MESLPKKKLAQETKELFIEILGRKPKQSSNNLSSFSDKDLMVLFEKSIQYGYKLGYNKFYTPLCDRCDFNRATCFGPGAYCDECSLEEIEEREEQESFQ